MSRQIGALTTERADLDLAIEEMIADMAERPSEQRASGDWGSDGAMTRKYLALTNRQAEVEAEIARLNRAIAEDQAG
jgi:hypothetical protein